MLYFRWLKSFQIPFAKMKACRSHMQHAPAELAISQKGKDSVIIFLSIFPWDVYSAAFTRKNCPSSVFFFSFWKLTNSVSRGSHRGAGLNAVTYEAKHQSWNICCLFVSCRTCRAVSYLTNGWIHSQRCCS